MEGPVYTATRRLKRRSHSARYYGNAWKPSSTLVSGAVLCARPFRRRLHRSPTDRAPFHAHTIFGDSSLAAAGPRVWNRLPAHMRDEDISNNSFRRKLKS